MNYHLILLYGMILACLISLNRLTDLMIDFNDRLDTIEIINVPAEKDAVYEI